MLTSGLRSATLTGLVYVYGNFVDATILTGLTSHVQSFLPGLSTWSHSISAENDPKRFGELSSTSGLLDY
jgi:hypothetical protein